MKYQVKILETLGMNVEVEAPSEEEAVNQVRGKYLKEEITVASKIEPDVAFIVSPIE